MDLIKAEQPQILELYTQGKGLDPLVESVREAVHSFEHDLTTGAGRARTASLSAKVSKAKTFLDGLGKDLVSEWKEKAKVVDSVRKNMRDELDELRDEARAPLTAWEKAEEERICSIQDRLDFIDGCVPSGDLEQMQGVFDDLSNEVINESFGEFQEKAIESQKKNLEILAASIAREIKAEQDRVELERLRAEKEESDRKEQERLALEAKAKAAKEEAEAKVKEEERLRKEGEERARKEAEAEKKKAIEEAELKELEARRHAERQEQEKKEAIERAEKAEENARLKAEAEKKAEQEAEAKREANALHNKKLKTEAKEAMMGTGLSEEDSIKIIIAICENKIPHISMRF